MDNWEEKDLWEEEEFEVEYNGNKFKFTKLDVDISLEFEKPVGTVLMSYKIEGFEIPLYMIIDEEDSTFGFGYRVSGESGVQGLFVTLQDDNLFSQAVELVAYIDSLYSRDKEETQFVLDDYIWQSDWNGDEVGYPDIPVVGLYQSKENPNKTVYVDTETMKILETFYGQDENGE